MTGVIGLSTRRNANTPKLHCKWPDRQPACLALQATAVLCHPLDRPPLFCPVRHVSRRGFSTFSVEARGLSVQVSVRSLRIRNYAHSPPAPSNLLNALERASCSRDPVIRSSPDILVANSFSLSCTGNTK